MNKKGNTKLRHLERYKSGESKFSSCEESRQLRALKKKEEQKFKRDAILTKIRGAMSDNSQTKSGQFSMVQPQTLSTKKLSKSELKEMGIKRYQEMLKWKEEKRKLLEREKKARKPAFKTGFVKPDKPQFLQDAYVDKKDLGTPFKFSVIARDSVRKSSLLSSICKENKNTLNRKSRALSFYTGMTPQTSGIESRGCRRANRIFRPPPEYGITPLPKTPGLGIEKGICKSPELIAPTRSSLILKESKSFAPNNFNFQAPKGLQKYPIKEASFANSVHISPKKTDEIEFSEEVGLQDLKNIEFFSENLDANESEVRNLRETYFIDNDEKENKIDDVLCQKETSDSEGKLIIDEKLHVKKTSNTDENIEDINILKKVVVENINRSFEKEIGVDLEVLKSHEPKICKEEEEIECSNEHFGSHQVIKSLDFGPPELNEKNNINILSENLKKDEIIEVQFKKSSEHIILEVDSVFKEGKEISETESCSDKENLEQTDENKEMEKENVANKNICTKFSNKNTLSNFTPPFARLRPRTPCSRSTRRSRLAHCDTPCFQDNRRSMTTPISSRRKSKRSSKVKTEKLNEFVGNYSVKSNSTDEPSYETSPQKAEDDVLIRKTLSEERIDYLKSNPWITRSRGSNSSTSSKQKNEFNSMSGEKDIGAASPQLKTAVSFPVSHEISYPPLEEKKGLPIEFLQQQEERDPESLDVCVWGPESVPNSPTVAIKYSEDSSSANVNLKLKSSKRKRLSSKKVSLLTDYEAVEGVPSVKYPVTPKRRPRISSTGNQRVSLLPGLYPRDEKLEMNNIFIHGDVDLMSFDSPAAASPRVKGRPSKSRVKVLSGLSPYSEEAEKSAKFESINETSDLVVWDSPKVSTSKKKSNIDTPLRRSKRLSKI